MNVVIRNIKKRDYEQVKELFVDLVCKMAEYRPLRRKEPLPEYKDWYFQKALSSVKRGTGQIGIAEGEGVIVGCIYGCVEDQTKDELLEYKKITLGHIHDVYIKDEYRGQGIGKKLFRFIEDFLKSKACDYIQLAVPAKNIRPQKLYQELGYEDDRVEMLKNIRETP